MSSAPSRAHQRVLGELFAQIHQALRGGPCQAYLAPFGVRLPSTDRAADGEIDCVVQPDLSVICDPNKLDDRGCFGAPDWILEIESLATAAHDQITKRGLYERHGVRKYWLVHPTDQTLTRYQLNDEGRYGASEIRDAHDTTRPELFPGLSIDWNQVF